MRQDDQAELHTLRLRTETLERQCARLKDTVAFFACLAAEL
jgi:hypothetical protein